MDKRIGGKDRLDGASAVITGEQLRKRREQRKRRQAIRGNQQRGQPTTAPAEEQEKVILSQPAPKAAEPREQDIEIEEEAQSGPKTKVDVYV